MQTIGLIGGMSWESSLLYYRLINQGVRERLGGLHSAKLVMYSVDFHDVERMQMEDRWGDAGALLGDAAAAIERGGADFVVLCTNTMHKVAAAIEARVRIPLLHIADATGRAAVARGIRRVGLLGTRFTMEEDFYRARLAERFGLGVSVPPEDARRRVNEVIYDELCQGRIVDASRDDYRRVAASLVDGGAEAIVLGCTEIGLLLRSSDVSVPVLDTTVLHAEWAVEQALAR